MSVVRIILAVVVGFLVGSAVMMGMHMATAGLYPPPEGLDVYDPDQREAVKEWMKTLPDGAFVVAAIAHWIGCAAGVAIAMLITLRRSMRPAWILGGLFLVAGIINVSQVPHPGWFPFVDIPGYLVVAWLVGTCMLRKSDAPPDAPA